MLYSVQCTWQNYSKKNDQMKWCGLNADWTAFTERQTHTMWTIYNDLKMNKWTYRCMQSKCTGPIHRHTALHQYAQNMLWRIPKEGHCTDFSARPTAKTSVCGIDAHDACQTKWLPKYRSKDVMREECHWHSAICTADRELPAHMRNLLIVTSRSSCQSAWKASFCYMYGYSKFETTILWEILRTENCVRWFPHRLAYLHLLLSLSWSLV